MTAPVLPPALVVARQPQSPAVISAAISRLAKVQADNANGTPRGTPGRHISKEKQVWK